MTKKKTKNTRLKRIHLKYISAHFLDILFGHGFALKEIYSFNSALKQYTNEIKILKK